MKVYNYDVNGKYTNESIADESPLEEGVFLIPAMATDKQPLLHKDGFDVIWIGTKWEYIERPKEKPNQPNEYSIWDEASCSWIEDDGLKRKYEENLIIQSIENHLDTSAKAKGYDDIKSAALRSGIPNSPFHAEGIAFGAWMDQCWAYSYQVKADVIDKKRIAPTVQELIAELPVLVLP